jgi:carbamoyltransferase
MITWGINALNHGSSLSVFSGDQLVINESCSTDQLDPKLIHRAFNYGGPDRIYWYEQPWIKKARQLYAGQYSRAFDMSVLPRKYINDLRIHYSPIIYTPHHASHAAAGYYTSPFDHCAVVVLDAIGEFECASIWEGKHGELRKVWTRSYPNSLGLFYSAFTDLLGLTPIKDEKMLENNFELILQRISDSVKINIIDLGPGNSKPLKNFLLKLSDLGRLNSYAAVDISPEMIEISQKNIQEWLPDLPYFSYVCDFETANFNRILEQQKAKFEYETVNIIFDLGRTLSNQN